MAYSVETPGADAVSSRSRNSRGFLRATGAFLRSGPHKYHGFDVPVGPGERGEDVTKIVEVTRTPETTFAPETLRSLRDAPITVGHPKSSITAENAKDVTVGYILGDPRKTDTHVEADFLLFDKDAIESLEAGQRELSIGYSFSTEKSGGKRQTVGPLDINHVALVERGRGGPSVRVYDSIDSAIQEQAPMNEKSLVERIKNLVVGFREEAGDDAPKGAAPAAQSVAGKAEPAEAVDLDAIRAEAAKEAVIAERRRAGILRNAESVMDAESFGKLTDESTEVQILEAATGESVDSGADLRTMLAMMAQQKRERVASAAEDADRRRIGGRTWHLPRATKARKAYIARLTDWQGWRDNPIDGPPDPGAGGSR